MRPLDVYPEHKQDPDQHIPKARNAEGAHDLSWVFATVETDAGVSGMAGPLDVADAFTIDTQITPFILGADPLASERIWDQLYRFMIHGRMGSPMFAISAIDTALWDLKGRWLGQPLYRLLGGPVRREIPAYASALGYSIEPERVTERARQFVSEGYTATKWFVRFAPDDGEAGARRNVDLMRVLREAVGDDVDVMLDAWSSWDVVTRWTWRGAWPNTARAGSKSRSRPTTLPTTLAYERLRQFQSPAASTSTRAGARATT